MKISIWQQFSSNHSSYFGITGTFKTFEEAHQAYDELRRILMEIDQWHRENVADSDAYHKNWDSSQPTAAPPELEIAKRYSIEWPDTIDWMGWADYRLVNHPIYKGRTVEDFQRQASDLIDRVVTLAAKQIEISSPGETAMSPLPFAEILHRLGADVTGSEVISGGLELLVNYDLQPMVGFEAPDDTIADLLHDQLQGYFSSITSPFSKENSPANIEDMRRSHYTPKGPFPPWMGYIEKITSSAVVRKDAIERAFRANKDFGSLRRALDSGTDTTDGAWFSTGMSRPPKVFVRDGLKFRLEGLFFEIEAVGFQVFLAYLEGHGCKVDVEYVRVPIELPPEEDEGEGEDE